MKMEEENNNREGSLVKKLRGAKEKIAELNKKPGYILFDEISFYPVQTIKRAANAIRILSGQPKLYDLLELPNLIDNHAYVTLILYLCRESGVTVDDLPF